MECKNIALGENIKFQRESLCMKQDQLADVIGASKSQIIALEKNKTANPGFFIIESLADFFGNDIRDLVHRNLNNLSLKEQLLNRLRFNASAEDLIQFQNLVDGQNLRNMKSSKFRYGYRQIKK